MKWILLLLLMGFAGPSMAATIPESKRSRAAIKHVTPDLKRDFATAGFEWGSPFLIRIFKEEGQLEVWIQKSERYELFRDYEICAWSGDLGPKLKEGDGQAPEGFYEVRPDSLNPHSRYHLSFNLGFPNRYDRAHGRTGSYLMVHGDCASIGCYAMATGLEFFSDDGDRNRPIEEIWTMMVAAFEAGSETVPVQAYPFRMTPNNLKRHADNKWQDFWANLQEGDRLFTKTGQPPVVDVTNKRYRFTVR